MRHNNSFQINKTMNFHNKSVVNTQNKQNKVKAKNILGIKRISNII